MKVTKSASLLFIIALILHTSCFKELADDINNIDELQWNPTLAIPLANGSFAIDEFAEELSGDNFSTTTREDGLIVFLYSQDTIFRETAEELIVIGDANYSATIQPVSASLPDLPIAGTITNEEFHEFSINPPENDKVYSAIIKGSTLDLELIGNFPASGELVFTFDNLTNNGTPLQTTFSWTYDGSGTQQFSRSIDLDGIEMDLSNNGTTYNYFYFTSALTLNYEGQPVSSFDGIDLAMNIQSLMFSKALLTAGNRSISTENHEITFDLMDELGNGTYYFDEPAIQFLLRNSIGVPIEVAIENFVAQSASNGNVALTGEIIQNPIAIGYPLIDEIGTTVNTEIRIDHQNSNFPEILASQPTTITYTFEGTSNPQNNNDVHFVLDTSRVSADIILELPMIGRFSNLMFTENYDFDGGDLEEAQYALFRLFSSNGFPINADLQLYFLTETGSFIDSLIYDDRRLLEAGAIDNTGKVVTPTEKTIDILVPKERLDPISNASQLLLRANLNTPQNDTRSVRIYSEDQLMIKLHVQTEFEIIL